MAEEKQQQQQQQEAAKDEPAKHNPEKEDQQEQRGSTSSERQDVAGPKLKIAADDPGHETESGGEKTQAKASEPDRSKTDGHPPGYKKPDHHTSSLEAVKGKFLDQKQKIMTKAHPPGGFDDTPLPDAPQGYTVRFIFHRATNLPAADLATASSDPFLFATLRTATPKRHKEDPDLSHRTRTLRRCTEAKWEDEWVVANVPPSGFTLKCRLYDEDSADHNDRLGNVTIKVPRVDESWGGFPPPGREFRVKKRVGSKRAYLLKGVVSALSREVGMTPSLFISIEVVGKSDPPHAQMHTVGPAVWMRHFSPMIGRLTGTKVHKDENDDVHSDGGSVQDGDKSKKSKRYDFQAIEMQLAGPVPEKLYHRYVAFRPAIGLMFSSHGLRGKILNKALHKQHAKVYNFDSSTEYGTVEPCSEEATMQFLRLAHFDEGGRIFTYVLTLDAALRFTETGKEFGIDLLSKHTMHSDVATYIACSGEFFIRRLERPDASTDPEPQESTHPDEPLAGGPPMEKPPHNPSYYQLIIDNDSGTYRPDKSVLPELKEFLEQNLPGLGIVVMHCQDEELTKLKEAQARVKKEEGRTVNMILNRSPSSSSMSSQESALDAMDRSGDGPPVKSVREMAWDIVEEPRRLKGVIGGDGEDGESSKPKA